MVYGPGHSTITPQRRFYFGSDLPSYATRMQPDQNLISGEWNSQPAVVVFTSPQNIAYLKQEVLRRSYGSLGDIDLLNYMRMYGVDFYEATCDYDYPAMEPAEVSRVLALMNERTLDAINRDYFASRQWIGLWRQLSHTGTQVGDQMPVKDYDGFSHEIETDPTQGWREYNYK